MLLRLAWRNLWRQRRRSILTGLTMVIGFFLVSISIGMQYGSWGQVIEGYTGSFSGHMQIHSEDYQERPSLYKNIRQSELEVLDELPYLTAWTPRVYSAALAYAKDRALGVGLAGFDPVREQATTTTSARLWKGEFFSYEDPYRVLVSYNLAQRLKLELDDELILIGQGADGSIANDIFTVGGVLGLPDEGDTSLTVFLPLATAQEFLTLGARVHEVALKVDSYHNARYYTEQARRDLQQPDWDIQPWQVIEKSFYQAMQADNKGSYIAIAIVGVMVGLGVLNTVLMNMLERTREFGIMKAIGTRPGQLLWMVMVELTLLATVCCVIGGCLAWCANAYLTWYGIPLGEPIHFGGLTFSRYYSTLDPETFWLPTLVVMGTTWVVGFIPAYRLTRLRAVEALCHS